jgi:hypothetical protein
MPAFAQSTPPLLASDAMPRILFVLGKGGVGRSTVAAALALSRVARGERVLVVEWAIADPIGPWFGAAPAGATPSEVSPDLLVTNFSLAEALRAYFVDHLHLGVVYRRLIRARSVAHMLEIAPGLPEMFFLGQMWWLTNLAEREAGIRADRIIVDAPATGHGTSLLDVPATIAKMGAAGLLALETRRVTDMLADPAQVGAVVVAWPELLIADETFELIPRVTARLGRAPRALVINGSARGLAGSAELPPWLAERGPSLPGPSRAALEAMSRELASRAAIETELRDRAACPAWSIPDLPGSTPIDVVRAAARALEGLA